MSGGYFDYDQHRLQDMIDKIQHVINENDTTEWYNYSQDTINEFKNAIDILKIAYVYTQRIDWLVSADDSEDTFHKRLAEEMMEALNE
jgi:hypothetical protein